jgi:hypothetical protein
MRRIFLDDKYEAFFKENGYIKLPFERVEEIDVFRERIMALHPSDNFKAYQKNLIHEQDYHCTFLDRDKEYRKGVYDIITNFFQPTMEYLLCDYCFAQANVFIKPPNKGYVAPHQNLTILDENVFTSLLFGAPLSILT